MVKKILITGVGSYIGTSFERYLENLGGEYIVESVDMIGDDWKNKDFSGYDAVFHVSGIAHIKETNQNRQLYYDVNHIKSVETAKKAKQSGVPLFVFLSTMSVYGMNTGVITKDTKPNPKNAYGDSKLKAENDISSLADSDFKVAVIRPPMVYGKGCKGNFNSILKLINKFPIFPDVQNKRSMIYIDNLCELVRMIIEFCESGIFCPQNKNYVCTSDMAKVISKKYGKKIRFSRILGFVCKIFMPFVSIIKKAFGSLLYKDLEEFDYKYCVCDFEKSVEKSI